MRVSCSGGDHGGARARRTLHAFTAASQRQRDASADCVRSSLVSSALATIPHPASLTFPRISIIGRSRSCRVRGGVRHYLNHARERSPARTRAPRLSTPTRCSLLAIGGASSAFVSDWFVHSARADDPTVTSSRGVRGPGDRGDRGQRGQARGRDPCRRQGSVRARDLGDQESFAQIARFPYPVLVRGLACLTASTLSSRSHRCTSARCSGPRSRLADHRRRRGAVSRRRSRSTFVIARHVAAFE